MQYLLWLMMMLSFTFMRTALDGVYFQVAECQETSPYEVIVSVVKESQYFWFVSL